MISRSQKVTRRTLLKGMGAMISLPWLDVMSSKTLAAQSGQKDPARLACFYIPGAINHYNWYPEDTGPNYTIAPSHKPLKRHRSEFSVLSHLLHVQGQISGHEHPYNWLTGTNIKITPGTITNSVSMDQVAAKYAGPTYLPSMALSWKDGVGTTTLSRNSMGTDIPATASYRKIFESLFPPSGKDQIQKAQERIALDKSILDTAIGDIKSFKQNLGFEDKARIDQYLQSVRDVESRLNDKIKILAKGRPDFDERNINLAPLVNNSMQDHIEILMDLIALAFQTDMTRVVTHCLGGEGGPNYDDYKTWAKNSGASLRGAHDFHHKGSGNRGKDNPDVQVIGQRDRMFSACLSRLMDKLSTVEASEGSLLDHTVLLLGGSQTSSHNGSSFPMLLAGGKKLGFKHGQHLKWDRGTKPASDLYLTILQQMGCPVQKFKESKGIISELLV